MYLSSYNFSKKMFQQLRLNNDWPISYYCSTKLLGQKHSTVWKLIRKIKN